MKVSVFGGPIPARPNGMTKREWHLVWRAGGGYGDLLKAAYLFLTMRKLRAHDMPDRRLDELVFQLCRNGIEKVEAHNKLHALRAREASLKAATGPTARGADGATPVVPESAETDRTGDPAPEPSKGSPSR